MQKITVLCVGKLKEAFYEQAVKEYEKRLSRYCKLELLELPEQRLGDEPSEAEIRQALKKEAALVEQKLPKGGALIAMCISMFGVSLVAMNTFAFGIRCAGPFAAYGLGLAVPKATKNSGMISIFTGTIAFVVWQLLSNGGTLWFMMPVVFGSLVSVITFYVVNLIEWKRGVPAAPSAYVAEEAK